MFCDPVNALRPSMTRILRSRGPVDEIAPSIAAVPLPRTRQTEWSGEPRQMRQGRLPGALGRERADVHFVDDLPMVGDSWPTGVGPAEGLRIHQLRQAVRPIRLKAGGGVGE